MSGRLPRIAAFVAVAVILLAAAFLALGGLPEEDSGLDRTGLCPYAVDLTPGETREATFIVNSGEWSGEVDVEVYPVSGLWKTEGLSGSGEVSVEPGVSRFAVEPNEERRFELTVSAGEGMRLGDVGKKYMYLVGLRHGDETFDDWLEVLVHREGTPPHPSFGRPRPPEYRETHLGSDCR